LFKDLRDDLVRQHEEKRVRQSELQKTAIEQFELERITFSKAS